MPSSMIFASLVVLWLLILVPAVARHRQEVARPSVAALSGRVLERQRRPEPDPEADGEEEAEEMDERPHGVATRDDDQERDVRIPAARTAPAEERSRYRPGRGGYDAEAAALAARARYTFRQRVVLGLLVAVVVGAVVAFVGPSWVWWLTGAAGVSLVGYLGYLRRQVRMEEAIRERRAARAAGQRRRPPLADELPADEDGGQDPTDDLADDLAEDDAEEDDDRVIGTGEPVGPLEIRGAEAESALPRLDPAPPPPLPAGTALVLADDEEPELNLTQRPGYRRAAGE